MDGFPGIYERYLRLIGIDHRPTGFGGLEEIVARHLCRVPFENVSKLLLVGREKKGRMISLSEFLDGIECADLGGTCYSNNPFLASLLSALGYDAALLGADMANPDVHTSIRVHLDGASYHVDVGYAAPFAHPIRLDDLPHEIAFGDYRYVLDRDSHPGRHRMSVFADGECVHEYVVHQPPRALEFFRRIILESYELGKTFMTQLRITRFFEDRAVEIRNRKLVTCLPGERRETMLDSMAELRRAVDEDLQMPRCPIEEAVEVLEQLNNAPFFFGGDETREFVSGLNT